MIGQSVGLIFQSIDRGLSTGFSVAEKGLNGIFSVTDSIAKSGTAATNAMLGFQAMQLRGVTSGLGRIEDSLRGMTSGGIDTRLEGMFTAFDKGFAPAAARAGKTGAALKGLEKQVFSTAFAMNRSADDVGRNILALERAGLSLEGVLGKGGTMADYQKVLEATGMSSEAFSRSFNLLSKRFKMGEPGARKYLDTFSKQVTALGMGEQAFKSLPGMLESMDQALITSLREQGPEAAETMIKSMVNLGAVLQEHGTDPMQSLSKASTIFSAFAKSSEAIPNMLSGQSVQFDDLTNELTFLEGGIEGTMKALAAASKDPAKFTAKLSGVYEQLGKQGGEAGKIMQKRLLVAMKDLGPDFINVIRHGSGVADTLADVEKKAKAGGQGLRELGRDAFRSGRTLQDRLGVAKTLLEDAFGKASTKDRQAFVVAQEKAFAKLSKGIGLITTNTKEADVAWREMATGMGLSAKSADTLKKYMGPVVQDLSLLAFGGTTAVLVKYLGENSALANGIGFLADGFFNLTASLVPLIPLLTPLFMVVAGAGWASMTGLASVVLGLATAIGGVLSPVLIPAAIALGGLQALALSLVVPLGAIAAGIMLISGATLDGLIPGLTSVTSLLGNLALKGSGLLDAFSSWVEGQDPRALAKSVKSWIRSAVNGAMSLFGFEMGDFDLTKEVDFGSAMSKLGSALLRAARATGGFASEFLSELLGFSGASMPSMSLPKGSFSEIGHSMVKGVKGAVMSAWTKLGSLYDQITDSLMDQDWLSLGIQAGSQIGKALAFALNIQDYLKEALVKYGPAIGSALYEGLKALDKWATKALTYVFREVTDPKFWATAFGTIWSGLKMALTAWTAFTNLVTGVFLGILGEAADAGSAYMKTQVDKVATVFSDLWAKIRDGAFSLFGNSINEFVAHDFNKIYEIVESAKSWFWSLADTAEQIFSAVFRALTAPIEKVLSLGTGVRELADRFGITKLIAQAPQQVGAAPVRTSLQMREDADLIGAMEREHAKDREILRQILGVLRDGGGPARGTVAPRMTTTGAVIP